MRAQCAGQNSFCRPTKCTATPCYNAVCGKIGGETFTVSMLEETVRDKWQHLKRKVMENVSRENVTSMESDPTQFSIYTESFYSNAKFYKLIRQ